MPLGWFAVGALRQSLGLILRFTSRQPMRRQTSGWVIGSAHVRSVKITTTPRGWSAGGARNGSQELTATATTTTTTTLGAEDVAVAVAAAEAEARVVGLRACEREIGFALFLPAKSTTLRRGPNAAETAAASGGRRAPMASRHRCRHPTTSSTPLLRQGAFQGRRLALAVVRAMRVLGMDTGSRDLPRHSLLVVQARLPRQATEATAVVLAG